MGRTPPALGPPSSSIQIPPRRYMRHTATSLAPPRTEYTTQPIVAALGHSCPTHLMGAARADLRLRLPPLTPKSCISQYRTRVITLELCYRSCAPTMGVAPLPTRRPEHPTICEGQA